MHYVQKADCLGHQQELDLSTIKLHETTTAKQKSKYCPHMLASLLDMLGPLVPNKCSASQRYLISSVWIVPLFCNFNTINSATQSHLYPLLFYPVI